MDFIFVGFLLFSFLVSTQSVMSAFASPASLQNSTGENYTIVMNSSVSPITVTTDSKSYNDGDRILISGTTRDYIQNMPITVIIRNPVGNIVVIAQVPLGADKTYSTTVQAGGTLWQASGTYEVDVIFGTPDRSAKTTFQFAGAKVVLTYPNTIAVKGTNFTIPYSVTNGKILDMKTDSQSKSLLIAVQTAGDGVFAVTLPRSFIDAKAGSQDDQYYVLLDGAEADFDETSTTLTDRTLSIPFTDGTEEIEIIGTQVIPEFGPITALVLAIAIILIIALYAKTGLRFMQNY